ncbi:MAG: hypothetical protein NXI25_26430, partial [bacterium]|nr:hypothetical protein [bacterium]
MMNKKPFVSGRPLLGSVTGKGVFLTLISVCLMSSLFGQRAVEKATHPTSFTEAFELGVNEFLFKNPDDGVKSSVVLGQRTTSSCVSIPGTPCPEDALNVTGFDFIPNNSIVVCSQSVDNETDDSCFSPGDIPPGVSFSSLSEFNDLIALGASAFGNSSAVFGPNTFTDDLEISFSVPTTYVEFDLFSLSGTGAVDVEVYDLNASLICTESAFLNSNYQKVVIDAGSPISSIIINGMGQSLGDLIDNFAFSNNGCEEDCDGWIPNDIGDSNGEYLFDLCSFNNDNYNISTDGYHLIPNTSDNMAFASLPLCGNGGIQARIEDVEGGYAGLMI